MSDTASITIPPAAMSAGIERLLDLQGEFEPTYVVSEICRAMLTAWPGMREIYSVQLNMRPAIILPLPPQEKTDG